MKISEYKALIKKPKKSKYKNKKTNGYDSTREARRAHQLKLMEKQGLISNLREQVPFELIKSFKDSSGKTERGVKIIVDFVYQENGFDVADDSKGFRTKDYILKRKMFKVKYPQYIFKES